MKSQRLLSPVYILVDYARYHSYKDESSQRENASNYQDTAKGIHVCTRFSSGGGKQL